MQHATHDRKSPLDSPTLTDVCEHACARPHLASHPAQAQVSVIISSIVPKIHEQYQGLGVTLRFALVAYRDHSDPQPLVAVVDFDDTPDALVQQVRGEGGKGGNPKP